EAEAVVREGEDAAREDGAPALGLGIQDAEEELGLRDAGDVLEVEVALGEADQIVSRTLFQVRHVQDRHTGIDLRHRLQRRIGLGRALASLSSATASTAPSAS